jgi:hypothetical protein
MLSLADGRRTVADLVRLTGRGEFATVKTLAALVDRKLVTVRRGDDDATDSVAALIRRQAELSSLEGKPEPAPEPVAVAEPVRAPRPEVVPDVVPQRPEPLVSRKPEYPEEAPAQLGGGRRPTAVTTETDGSAAVATETVPALIGHDPSVNKSLLLRLIAGVRGL